MTKKLVKTFNLNRLTVKAIQEMNTAVAKGGLAGYNEWDEKLNPINRSGSSVTYMVVIDDKGVIRHNSNQACHAGISSPTINGSRPARVISRLQWENTGPVLENFLTKEMKIAFLEWLTMESPYAEAFLFGGGEKALRRGYLICRTDIPSNLLAGALIASRAATEYKASVMKSWYEMSTRGLNKNLSFYLGHWYADGASGLVDKGYRSSHVALDGNSYNKGYILNFCNGEKGNAKGIYDKGNYGYAPVHYLWKEGNELSSTELKSLEIGTYKEAKQLSQGAVKKSVNPFAAAAAEQIVVNSKIFYDLFVPRMKEFFKELKHD